MLVMSWVTSLTAMQLVIKHGIKLDFCGEPICSNLTPLCSSSAEGIKAVNKEIQTLLLHSVIAPVTLKRDSFVSTSVFTTEKSDGSHRTILNQSIRS